MFVLLLQVRDDKWMTDRREKNFDTAKQSQTTLTLIMPVTLVEQIIILKAVWNSKNMQVKHIT